MKIREFAILEHERRKDKMNYKEIAERTIMQLDQNLFLEMKKELTRRYIKFVMIDDDAITPAVLSEKLYDYFTEIESVSGKNFEKLIKTYMDDMDDLIEGRIAKPNKKKGESHAVPRARRYYEHAVWVRKEKMPSLWGLTEYSRIMMCLYMSIIKEHLGIVKDFDFAAQSIDIDSILKSIEFKDNKAKKVRESTKIIAIIMYYQLKNKEITGEY